MITTITLKVNSAHPNLSLGSFHIYRGSAISVTAVDVPRAIGKRSITGVTLRLTDAQNVTTAYTGVRVGSAWCMTVPADVLTVEGTVKGGMSLEATGTDDTGTAVGPWKLGKGDLTIMSDGQSITPGTVDAGMTIVFSTTAPQHPKIGSVWYSTNAAAYFVYTGRQWKDLSRPEDYLRKSAAPQDADLDVDTNTLADTMRRVNKVMKFLKTGTAVFAAVLTFAASGAVQKAKLADLPGGAYVVTNVTGGAAGSSVESVNGKTGVVELVAADVGARASDWLPSIDEIGAQTNISDLAEIRSGAALGSTALQLAYTNEFAAGILSQSGRDCAGKIADATNAVTKVLKVTQGDSAWEYNGTEAVQIDLAQGGGGTDGAAVTNIVASIFPSNRVFGVDGGLLSAYDVSADGVETNEIWREARGYALTNGVERGGLVGVVNPAIDGTITTITIGDAATAAAGVSVDLPSAWDAEARDFAVYVFNGTTNAAPLRLPTNVSIYGYATSATNELKRDTVTALYFTEIRRDTFLLGRAEIISLQEGSHLPTEAAE